jgi:hypothetical protein
MEKLYQNGTPLFKLQQHPPWALTGKKPVLALLRRGVHRFRGEGEFFYFS